MRGRLPSRLSPFSILKYQITLGHSVRNGGADRWEWTDKKQAGVIQIKVCGCDQMIQKLSTDIILYTCNKLG